MNVVWPGRADHMKKRIYAGIIGAALCMLIAMSGSSYSYAEDASGQSSIESVSNDTQPISGTVTENETVPGDSSANEAVINGAAGSEPESIIQEAAGSASESSVQEAPAEAEEMTPLEVKDGWNLIGTDYYYYVNGAPKTGWLVTGTTPYGTDVGLQRYWLESDGKLSFNRLIDKSECGFYAYTTTEGYVARGVFASYDGTVYLADNNGRLEDPGWLITSRYSDGLQRYYIDPVKHGAMTGLFTVGSSQYYGIPDAGYVLRGALDNGTAKYYANNDGVLTQNGWVVTSAFGQGLQRYWFSGGAVASEGLAATGADGSMAYVRPEGYVVRGKYTASDGKIYLADNNGRLERSGWLITMAYDSDMERYYIDPSTYAASTGFFTVGTGNYYGIPGDGRVLRGGASVEGKLYYANNDGVLMSEGWVITSSFGQGLQRYWFAGGMAASEGLVTTSTDGSMAYVRPEGYVVRGKYTASSGTVYLADNDGRLANTGWLVTGAYDSGLQRYYIDPVAHGAVTGYFTAGSEEYYSIPGEGYVARGFTNVGDGVLLASNEGVLRTGSGWLVTGDYTGGYFERYYLEDICDGHAGARTGFYTVDGSDYYGVPNRGYVVRGKYKYDSDGMLLADNEGKLAGFTPNGWLVTGMYDGGTLQRYRIDDCCGGHAGAHTGMLDLGGDLYYGTYDGYVLRNATQQINGAWYSADNDGRLTLTYSPAQLSLMARAQGYSSRTGYLILVDKSNFLFGVFSGSSGSWSPVYFWDCGIGAPETPTLEGTYTINFKIPSFGHGYTCYWASSWNGDYLIHSGLYFEGTYIPMFIEMRTATSGGCIRLDYDNAHWVYNNIPMGTTVGIFS